MLYPIELLGPNDVMREQNVNDKSALCHALCKT